MRHAGPGGVHFFGLPPTGADQFHHRTHVVAGDIHDQQFPGFTFLTVDLPHDHFRLADGQFVSFTTHGFDEHGEVQNAASGHSERIFVCRLFDLQSDVRPKFPLQAFPQVAAGDILAVLAGQRRTVDGECHRQCRFVHGDAIQSHRMIGIGDCISDFRIRQADQRHDIAGGRRHPRRLDPGC